jgi:hypothetical protein
VFFSILVLVALDERPKLEDLIAGGFQHGRPGRIKGAGWGGEGY